MNVALERTHEFGCAAIRKQKAREPASYADLNTSAERAIDMRWEPATPRHATRRHHTAD